MDCKKIFSSGGSMIFLRGRQLPKVFCRKLYENEIIWTLEGREVARPCRPWIRQCLGIREE